MDCFLFCSYRLSNKDGYPDSIELALPMSNRLGLEFPIGFTIHGRGLIRNMCFKHRGTHRLIPPEFGDRYTIYNEMYIQFNHEKSYRGNPGGVTKQSIDI
jgi:hypothetical protein